MSGFTRVLKPDSGYTYITNKIKAKDKLGDGENQITEIRMLPYIEEGIMYDPLDPDGSSDAIYDSLGLPFCNVELLSYFNNGMNTLVSSIKPEDKQGNPINDSSPWYKFMSRMRFKVGEVHKNKSRGGCIEPAIKHWANFKENVFSRPQKVFLIQCLAQVVNGKKIMKDGKPSVLGPAVFAIPRYIYAKTQFFQKLLTKEDPMDAGPLTPQTCAVGDFYSPEKGCWMQLSRGEVDGNTSYELSVTRREMPLKIEQVEKMVKPWDSIIDVLYVEDSIKEIADRFEPRMLAYAFRNTFYEPYVAELGIDMSLADDVIEADREIMLQDSTKVRSKEEVNKLLNIETKDTVTQSAPQTQVDTVQAPAADPVQKELDSMGEIPHLGDPVDNSSSAKYKEALSNITSNAESDELSLD